MKYYAYLVIAILFEVAGAAMLKTSAGFSVLLPSILVITFYFFSFFFFVLALQEISLSVGYSVWAGVGTAGTALVGLLFFHEKLTFINFLGLFIIILGVVLMNSSLNDESKTSIEKEVGTS